MLCSIQHIRHRLPDDLSGMYLSTSVSLRELLEFSISFPIYFVLGKPFSHKVSTGLDHILVQLHGHSQRDVVYLLAHVPEGPCHFIRSPVASFLNFSGLPQSLQTMFLVQF